MINAGHLQGDGSSRGGKVETTLKDECQWHKQDMTKQLLIGCLAYLFLFLFLFPFPFPFLFLFHNARNGESTIPGSSKLVLFGCCWLLIF
jgi:hypothetical protein